MISLIVGTVVVGAVVSSTSYICLRSHPVADTKCHTPISRYTIRTNESGNASAAVLDSSGRQMCRFNLASSLKIFNNIYRLFGRLSVSQSTAEVAHFYRNMVGKGGYIEFFQEETPEEQSILPGFLSRFQPKKEELPPVRIHILAKLSGCNCEINFEQDHSKLLWCASERKLYKIEGSLKSEAAIISAVYTDQEETQRGAERETEADTIKKSSFKTASHSSHSVAVNPKHINPYLAVCVLLYFLLLENENTDK